jgi:hypothetical protein
MKNTVSDQTSVNKKFTTLLQTWREEVMPHVTEGWDLLSADQQGKLTSINSFWCGLHFIVGLSEQANKTLAAGVQFLPLFQKPGMLVLKKNCIPPLL